MLCSPTMIVPTTTVLRVLVVDDHRDAAAMECAMIRALGHACDFVTDASLALARVVSTSPDVVVLDIGMPELSGYEVARQIREQATAHPLVLVALTAWEQPADRARAVEAGFDLHVAKPASLGKLQQIIAVAQEKLARSKPHER